jgi:hypothetical protein
MFPTAGRVARPVAALLGLPLSTYTAALVSNTAVPAWHEAHKTLPFVFASGAALSAGATAIAITPLEHARPARRLALVAAVADVAMKELMVEQLGEQGEPYKQGAANIFRQATRGLIGAGAAVLFRAGGRSRPAAIVAGTLLCAGALCARWSTFKAGFQSAANPKYVIGPQRAAIDRGDRPGAARRQARVATPDRALGSPATTVA